MLPKSKPSRYIGESELYWHYERRYKDLIYPYCFPKYKTVTEVVKDRNGKDKVIIERIKNEMPEWLEELKSKFESNKKEANKWKKQ